MNFFEGAKGLYTSLIEKKRFKRILQKRGKHYKLFVVTKGAFLSTVLFYEPKSWLLKKNAF